MKKKRTLWIGLAVVVLLVGVVSVSAQSPPLGTAFTYQGRLVDGTLPASATYDFEFYLFDALSGPSQVGGPISINDLVLSDGYFVVSLDFGESAFNGLARFLEVRVRLGSSTGAFTTLTPRQELTASPYAIYSLKAPWSGLVGIPAGFADGLPVGMQIIGKPFSEETLLKIAYSYEQATDWHKRRPNI